MLPSVDYSLKMQNENLDRLYNTAVEKCRRNLKSFGGETVLVEGGGYEKIWLETQPMGGEMFARYSMEAALNNHLMFMKTQRADGRMAGSIQSFPDGRVEAQFNKFQGFCFPWSALNMYYWIGRDVDYLNKLAKSLESFDDYLWRVRDSNNDGVLESWCVFDTGEDNAVRYGNAPVYCTEDVPPEGYDVVPMASMDIMSFSYACRDTLAEISAVRQDSKEDFWREKAASVAQAIREKLWDDKMGACFDRDKLGIKVDVLCHNNLRCMYWGSFSQDMADRFVKEHLLNENEFWTRLPLPSVAVNDPSFRNAPENNWSGQCEGLTFQRAILALERYGYEKVVTALGKKLMQAIIDNGYVFTQQFDPFTGAASHVSSLTKKPLLPNSDDPFQDAYGPTLLAVLEFMAHIYGITMIRDSIWFSMARGEAFTAELKLGDYQYGLTSDGATARIFVNGQMRHECPCGVRVVTSQAGEILSTVEIE